MDKGKDNLGKQLQAYVQTSGKHLCKDPANSLADIWQTFCAKLEDKHKGQTLSLCLGVVYSDVHLERWHLGVGRLGPYKRCDVEGFAVALLFMLGARRARRSRLMVALQAYG